MKPVCNPAVAHWFDPPRGDEPDWRSRVQLATALCDGCPLVDPCLRTGRRGRESGVWGGELLDEGRLVPVHDVDASAARRAHAAYASGDRTHDVRAGEAAYRRQWRARKRQETAA